MHYSRQLIWLLLATIFLGSCAPVYIPNKVNTPMFSNKGEVQVGVYGGTAGFDPQVNSAVTDHIGLMLNGSFQNGKIDSLKDTNQHDFLELGVGYYTIFSEKGRFEIFGGYGFGNVKASFNNGFFTDYSDARVQRIFIQPDVGISTKVIDAALAMRFVFVNAEQDKLNITRAFFEPALTLKAGFKYVKFVWQIGLSVPFSANGLFEQQPFMSSFGIQGFINKGYSR